jgi:hypothetical protein
VTEIHVSKNVFFGTGTIADHFRVHTKSVNRQNQSGKQKEEKYFEERWAKLPPMGCIITPPDAESETGANPITKPMPAHISSY